MGAIHDHGSSGRPREAERRRYRRLRHRSFAGGDHFSCRTVDALKAYIAKRVNETTSKGVAREKLKPWIEAVEQAFDERLAELAGPEDVRKQPEG